MSDFKEVTRKMEKTLEVLDSQFGSVRAGRANSKVLDPTMALIPRLVRWLVFPLRILGPW